MIRICDFKGKTRSVLSRKVSEKIERIGDTLKEENIG